MPIKLYAHNRQAYEQAAAMMAQIQPDYIILDEFHRCGALGMTWGKTDPWMEKFQLVKSYYEQHGHTQMPADYLVDGIWLRRWLSEQTARLNGHSKSNKRLTASQIACLAEVGIYPQKKETQSKSIYRCKQTIRNR